MDGVGTKAVAKPLRAAQSGSEPETIGLAPEPEPFHQLSRWSRAVTTLLISKIFGEITSNFHRLGQITPLSKLCRITLYEYGS